MGVDHRLYIVARFIHFAMYIALSVEPWSIGCDRLAIEVYLDNVGTRYECGRHCARHEKMIPIFIGARTDVAKAVQDALVRQDVTCCYNVLYAVLVGISRRAALCMQPGQTDGDSHE